MPSRVALAAVAIVSAVALPTQTARSSYAPIAVRPAAARPAAAGVTASMIVKAADGTWQVRQVPVGAAAAPASAYAVAASDRAVRPMGPLGVSDSPAPEGARLTMVSMTYLEANGSSVRTAALGAPAVSVITLNGKVLLPE